MTYIEAKLECRSEINGYIADSHDGRLTSPLRVLHGLR